MRCKRWIPFVLLPFTMAALVQAGPARTVPLPGGIALDMVWIPAGTFRMGSPASEAGRRADEGPQTTVSLTRGYWLGRTHVTIGQWRAVMGTDPRGQIEKALQDETRYPFDGRLRTVADYMGFTRDTVEASLANQSDDLPMYFVSFEDAMEFGRRLNRLESAAGRLPAGYEFDLPTEAQWEYAARAGSRGATYGGLDAIAWYGANSSQGYVGKGFKLSDGTTAGPRPVGGKSPNHWGLYDMSGNVWQWCRDWYGPYDGGRADPAGPNSGTKRVNRGGSFGSSAADERSASRAANPPMEASAYRGFRIALVRRQP